jgi:hypothetical protein
MTDATPTDDSRITRRRAVIGGLTTLSGVGVLTAVASEPATALEVGSFDVDDAERDLEGPPTAVPITAEALVEGETGRDLQQLRVILQARHDRSTTELDSSAVFDVSGEFSQTLDLSADLLDHDKLAAADLNADSGASASAELRLSLVAQAVVDNQVEAEDSAFQEVNVTVNGVTTLTVSVGGEGEISIEGE